MTSYDDFLSRVLPEVPGCPELAAIQAVKDTVIQFAERTLIHQVDHDPVSTVAKIADYDLDAPVSGTKIIKIMKLWYSGTPIDPAAPDDVNDPTVYNQRVGDYQTQYGTPRTYLQKDPSTFSLFPIPEKSLLNAVTIRVALAPLRNSVECDDIFYEYWVEPIAAGAVARLQMSQNKAYSNPRLAQASMAEYMVGINEARQKASRGYTRANLTVKMRRI